MSETNWTWSLTKGLGWAIPAALGGLMAIKVPLSRAIAFENDYSLLVFPVVGTVLALWLGGMRSTENIKEETKKNDGLRERIDQMSKSDEKDGD